VPFTKYLYAHPIPRTKSDVVSWGKLHSQVVSMEMEEQPAVNTSKPRSKQVWRCWQSCRYSYYPTTQME